MKKALSLVLAGVIISILSCTGFAEEAKPILFRGIAWGEKYSNVIEMLSSTNLKWRGGSTATGRKIKSQASGSWSDYYDYECLYYTYTSSNSPKLTVAGYEVEDVYLYFAFTQDENGVIPKDQDHTSFYMAKYIIKPISMDAVFDDIRAKLTKLYGDPANVYSEGSIVKYNFCYWYGAENTMVILVDDDNYMNVSICYAWADGEELMQTANSIQYQAEVDAEAALFGTDNTDGL